MDRDRQHKKAAQLVAGPAAQAVGTARHDLEAAWADWSRRVQKADERAPSLRSAFDAGWAAARANRRPGRPSPA